MDEGVALALSLRQDSMGLPMNCGRHFGILTFEHVLVLQIWQPWPFLPPPPPPPPPPLSLHSLVLPPFPASCDSHRRRLPPRVGKGMMGSDYRLERGQRSSWEIFESINSEKVPPRVKERYPRNKLEFEQTGRQTRTYTP